MISGYYGIIVYFFFFHSFGFFKDCFGIVWGWFFFGGGSVSNSNTEKIFAHNNSSVSLGNGELAK